MKWVHWFNGVAPTVVLAAATEGHEAALPDPNHYSAIGWVIVIIVAIVWGVNQAMELLGRFRAEPPYHEQFAPRTEFEQCRAASAAMRAEVVRQLAEIRHETEKKFLTRELWEQAELAAMEFRNELRIDVKKLLQRTAHLATDITDE